GNPHRAGLCYFGVRVVVPTILTTLELVTLERNGSDYGWSFRLLRGKPLESEDFPHTTEIDDSAGTGGEGDDILDGTVELHLLPTNEQDPTRTDVPGGPSLRDLVGTCPDDFHRKFHLKPLSSALLDHALESRGFPLECQ